MYAVIHTGGKQYRVEKGERPELLDDFRDGRGNGAAARGCKSPRGIVPGVIVGGIDPRTASLEDGGEFMGLQPPFAQRALVGA